MLSPPPRYILLPYTTLFRSKASFLLEEFIVKEKQAGRWKLQFNRQEIKALIHGHCHEKALIGSRYLKEALALAYPRSEEHTSELQSLRHLVCRLLLEKKKQE